MAEEATTGGGMSGMMKAFSGGLSNATGGLTGVTKAAVGMGGALLTGQTQLTAYSSAIAQNTGLFGKSVGALVDGLATYAESALSEYQALTNIGATFGKEIKDIKVSAAEMGLTVEEMTSFIKSNNRSLRAFGGTTDVAIARFKALSNTVLDSAELGTQLRKLGYTTSDINEGLALYGEISDANSRSDRLSVQQQAAAAKNLMVELDGLAKLTGKSRDALADEMKEKRRQGDINAFLSGKTAEEQAAFTKELAVIQAKLGDNAAAAFTDIALRGAPTTEATRNAILAMGDGANDFYAAAGQFNSGDLAGFSDSLASASGAAADYQKTEEFRQTAMLGGINSVSSAYADASAAGYDYINSLDSTGDGELTGAEAERAIRTQIAEEQAKQMETTTGIFDATIDIQENLRDITTTVMETTIPRIEDAAVFALEKIAEVMPSSQALADGLAGGINNLFNVAESMDRQEVYSQRAAELAEQMRNAQTQQSVANEQVGADLGMGQAAIDTAVNDTATTTQGDVEAARAELLTANAGLNTALENLSNLTNQGLSNLDPPVRAAQAAAEAATARVEAAEENLSNTIINSIDGLREIQAATMNKISRFQTNPSGYTGGFAEGGSIGASEFGMVGEAGPEFISGPANVMSANTSMGVMQNLMKGIKNLDSSVQENSTNSQNTISNSNVGDKIDKLMTSKFDTMIQQLQMLVAIESNSVNTQTKSLRATKSLQGNMLKGI